VPAPRFGVVVDVRARRIERRASEQRVDAPLATTFESDFTAGTPF